MILYHGSNSVIEKPDVFHSRERVDFGKGFYVTPMEQQARKWSERFSKTGGRAVVSKYFFDESRLEGLSVIEFDSYSESWLDFILACRSGTMAESTADIISGGVANDKVFNTVELYFDGLIDKTEAIKRLKYEKPNKQLCFRTMRACELLVFEGSIDL